MWTRAYYSLLQIAPYFPILSYTNFFEAVAERYRILNHIITFRHHGIITFGTIAAPCTLQNASHLASKWLLLGVGRCSTVGLALSCLPL